MKAEQLNQELRARKAAIAQLWKEIEQLQEDFIKNATNETRIPRSFSFDAIHSWFELTRARYLTLPRSVMQAMPDIWQEKMVELLHELGEAYHWMPDKNHQYRVQLCELIQTKRAKLTGERLLMIPSLTIDTHRSRSMQFGGTK